MPTDKNAAPGKQNHLKDARGHPDADTVQTPKRLSDWVFVASTVRAASRR
jgi:hypothetical protein